MENTEFSLGCGWNIGQGRLVRLPICEQLDLGLQRLLTLNICPEAWNHGGV